jgi:hypothetical protein
MGNLTKREILIAFSKKSLFIRLGLKKASGPKYNHYFNQCLSFLEKYFRDMHTD